MCALQTNHPSFCLHLHFGGPSPTVQNVHLYAEHIAEDQRTARQTELGLQLRISLPILLLIQFGTVNADVRDIRYRSIKLTGVQTM